MALDENYSSVVTDEIVKTSLFNDLGPSAKLSSWSSEEFTQKGDNYSTKVIAIRVHFSNKFNPNELQTKTYVAKLCLDRQIEALKEIDAAMFGNEGVFLTVGKDKLNKVLNRAREMPLRTPHCVFTCNNKNRRIVVYRDLRLAGFQMFKNRVGMDVAHAKLAMSELARFHSASFLMKKYTDLHHEFPYINEILMDYSKPWGNLCKTMYDGSVDTALNLLKTTNGYDASKMFLENHKSKIMDSCSELIRNPLKQFECICHGDAWNNNMMFRYNSEKNPVEIMLLDLQLVRVSSLASDLVYFMYTTTAVETRKNNMDYLLNIYYATLCGILKAAGEMEMPFTRTELETEFFKYSLQGFQVSLGVIPALSKNTEEVSDFENFSEDDVKDFHKMQEEKNLKLLKNDEVFAKRFLYLFDELTESQILQNIFQWH